MGHVDPSHLVELALGHPSGETDDSDLRHVAACPRCRDELARMTRVVTAARGAEVSDLSAAPPGHLWQRVAQEALREADESPCPGERPARRGTLGRARGVRALLLTAAARLVRWLRIGSGRLPVRWRKPPWRRRAC
ncbi:hypothetical protein [Streptomyces sp. NPDC006997]|uniref:hypothetical protein n=1 Tax=Streptomyces sp. NPDC006997 TaxID=3155356 RepID=UPI003405A0CB